MTVSDTNVIWVVLSDIHANLPALAAVCRDARKQAQAVGASADQLRYISLGDVVDYGPDPVLCLNWVLKHCTVKIRGNHDWEASKRPTDRIGTGVKRNFWPMLIWTRFQLMEKRQILQGWKSIYPHPDLSQIPGLANFVLGHANLCGDDKQAKPNTV